MNKLDTEKKTTAVGMLCEGNSIRSVERMTGVHRDTIKLGHYHLTLAANVGAPAPASERC